MIDVTEVFTDPKALSTSLIPPKIKAFMNYFEDFSKQCYKSAVENVSQRRSNTFKTDNANTAEQDDLIENFKTFSLHEIANKIKDFQMYNKTNAFNDIFKEKLNDLLNEPSGHLGMKLLISTFFCDISLIAHFLHSSEKFSHHEDYDFCRSATNMLIKSPHPALFYPDILADPTQSIEIPEIKPAIPTSIAIIDSSFYIGMGDNHLAIVEVKGDKTIASKIIPFEVFSVPYSIVSKGKEIIFVVKDIPPLKLTNGHFYNLQMKYPFSSVFSKSLITNFQPPTISDGNKFYCIRFGEVPSFSTYIVDDLIVQYLDSVALVKNDQEMIPPFTELLPLSQESVASISVNGTFINFIFTQDGVRICRIFSVITGYHVKDVLLSPEIPINSMIFDPQRLGFWILSDSTLNFYKNYSNISYTMINYIPPKFRSDYLTANDKSQLQIYTNALSSLTQHFIGSNSPNIVLRFNGKGTNCLEYTIIQFIKEKKINLAQMFMIYLPYNYAQPTFREEYSAQLLVLLNSCYSDTSYKQLHKTIAYLFLSSLDHFITTDKKTSEILLQKILSTAEKYYVLIFRYMDTSKSFLSIMKPNQLSSFVNFIFSYDLKIPDFIYGILYSIQSHACCSQDPVLINMLLQEFSGRLLQTFTDTNDFQNTIIIMLIEKFVACLIVLAKRFSQFYKISYNLFGVSKALTKYIDDGNCKLLNKLIFEFKFSSFMIAANQLRSKHFIISKNIELNEFADGKYTFNTKIPDNFKQILEKIFKQSIIYSQTHEYIQKKIDKLCKMIEDNPDQQDLFMARANSLIPILPQPFYSVIGHLNGHEAKIFIKKSEIPISDVVKIFMELFDTKNNLDLLLFDHVQHTIHKNYDKFYYMDLEKLQEFIMKFYLNIKFPIPLLKFSKCRLIFSMNDIHAGDIAIQYERFKELVEISNLVEIFTQQINNTPNDIYFSRELRLQLIDILLMAKLIIKNRKSLDTVTQKVLEICKLVVYSGFSPNIKHCLEIYEMLFEYDTKNTEFLSYCINAIGNTLFMQDICIDQSNFSGILHIANLFAIFYRRYLKHKDIYNEFIKMLQNPSKQVQLLMLIICNNYFEVPTIGQRVEVMQDGKNISGTVEKILLPNVLVINNENNEIITINPENICKTVVKEHQYFDISLFKDDVNLILDIFENFDCDQIIFKPFFFSSLVTFCEIDEFCQKMSEKLIEKVIKYSSMPKRNYENLEMIFMESLTIYTSPLPFFCFDSEKVEIIDNKTSIINTLAKFDRYSFDDTLISMEEPSKFISTPLPLCIPFEIIFESFQNSEKENFQIFVTFLGENENSRFLTEKTSHKTTLKIVCDPKSKLLTVGEENYIIQPCVDICYVTIELFSDVFINYHVGIDFVYIEQSKWPQNFRIPKLKKGKIEEIPFEDSISNLWSIMNNYSLELSCKYCRQCLSSLVHQRKQDLRLISSFLFNEIEEIEKFKNLISDELIDLIFENFQKKYDEMKELKVSFNNNSAYFTDEKQEESLEIRENVYLNVPKNENSETIISFKSLVNNCLTIVSFVSKDKEDFIERIKSFEHYFTDFVDFIHIKDIFIQSKY